MAFGIEQIAPETFAQANPFIAGFSAGQDLIGQGIQNQVAAAQAPYAGPQAAAQLGLTQAQAALTGAQVPYAGYQALGSYFGGMGRYFGTQPSAMLLKEVQQSPQLQALMNTNKQFAQQVENAAQIVGALGGGEYFNMLPAIPGSTQQYPQQNFPTSGTVTNTSGVNLAGAPQGAHLPNNMAPQQSPQSAQVQNAYQNSLLNGAPVQGTTPQAFNMPPMTPQSAQQNASDISAMQAQNTNNLLTKNLSKAQLAAVTYDNSAHNMMSKAAPYLPSVTSFSGIQGLAELKRQQGLAAAGKPTSEAYQNYLNYTREQMPTIANEIRRAFQGQATDTENEAINDLLSPAAWDQNPQNNLNRLQTLMGSLDANTKAITQTYAQNFNQAVNQKPVQIPGATNQSGQINIPSFNNSKEFVAWYQQLPYTQQLQVRRQLGEK